MSRPLRIQFEGAFYHVLARGNERRPIFRDPDDYVHFLALLGVACQRFGPEVWSCAPAPSPHHLRFMRCGGKDGTASQRLATISR